jgi:transcriptional regulator with XRE-family HTH domain
MITKTKPPGWRPTDTIGARLILMRRTLGLTQREAAALAGIPFGQWQGLEDDERHPRGLDVKVQRIVRAFNVDRDWLIWGGPLDPNEPAATGEQPIDGTTREFTGDSQPFPDSELIAA